MSGSILIAAHHYQRPEIVARADLLGDSYKLAVEASRTDARYIVLCGVRFMAESAAILAREGQTVLLPDRDAGCPMADMMDEATAERVLSALRAASGNPVVPVTYMNSWASLKALTGREGGSICTSSNAERIVSHFLAAGKPVFFMPDFNLGINTARTLGIPEAEIRKVRRDGSIVPVDGTEPAAPNDSLSGVRMFLWDGFCHVHQAFTPDLVSSARREWPGVSVIVHPECPRETVALADASGSTEAMYRILRDAPDGTKWAVGTEGRFVDRMIAEFPAKEIRHLKISLCPNMNRIDLRNLDETIEAIRRHEKTGAPLPAITVAPEEKAQAALALNAMVRITEAG